MNKFAILALFAFVAVALAQEDDALDTESQAAALVPSDDEEIQFLPDNQQAYAEFCKTSRDYVKGEIRTSSNRVASAVFTVLFQSAETLGHETVNTVQMATNRLGQQLKNPEANIAPANDEVEEIIREAQQQIREGEPQPKAFLTGFKATVQAISRRAGNFVSQGIEKIQTYANPGLLWDSIVEVCKNVESYEQELKKQFADVKATNGDNVSYEDLQCVTTRRVARVEGICKFTSAVRPTLPKLINFGKKN